MPLLRQHVSAVLLTVYHRHRGTWGVRIITKDGIKEIIISAGDIPAPHGARPMADVAMESTPVQPMQS